MVWWENQIALQCDELWPKSAQRHTWTAAKTDPPRTGGDTGAQLRQGKPSKAEHACNPNIWEVGTGGSGSDLYAAPTTY